MVFVWVFFMISEDTLNIVSNHTVSKPHTAAQISIVDFGLAKLHHDTKASWCIFNRTKSDQLFGTARYMSRNAHLGKEHSYRDDLESLGYLFFYFLRGSLPWQGLRAESSRQHFDKVLKAKRRTSIKKLCANHPPEFGEFLKYTRNLGFASKPNYDFLRGLMDKGMYIFEKTVFCWLAYLNLHQKPSLSL